jgi:hypothetical protein
MFRGGLVGRVPNWAGIPFWAFPPPETYPLAPSCQPQVALGSFKLLEVTKLVSCGPPGLGTRGLLARISVTKY